jgi:PAS domain S-box-containing protein
MYWYLTVVSLLLLLSVAASIVFALYAWKRRPVPGSVAFSLFMLAVAQWTLAYLLQIVSVDMAAKIAWAKFQYLGAGIAPVAWLIFSFRYTERPAWLSPRNLLLLFSLPIVTFLFVLTNGFHQLIWVNVEAPASGWLQVLQITPGAWYLVFVVFLYGAFLAGSLLLLTSVRYEIASLRPRQAFTLLVGLTVPWFGGLLYASGLSSVNLTPLAFALCGVIVGKYALNFQFVKRTPLSHQTALYGLPDAVFVLDLEGRIVDANPSAAEVAERPLSTLIGSPLQTVEPALAEMCEQAQTQPIDVRLGQNGSTHFYEARRAPLYDWRKFASSDLLILHDITNRKQQESAREDITHSMVHDLRSPISNSLFALEMLKNTGNQSDADNQRLVDLTYENTEKVLNLVNHILDVNKLENGSIPVQPTAVSLPKLVDRVFKGHLPRAEAKQIILIRDMPGDLPVAWADENLLERILQNLIDNSIKFSPVGGRVQVTAVCLREPENNKRVLHISVKDDGPGLSPEIRETIFDKFVTGGHRESGNGLGLSFCRLALAAHNQQIWVENRPEAGAAFTFSLDVPAQLPEDIYLESDWPEVTAVDPQPSFVE